MSLTTKLQALGAAMGASATDPETIAMTLEARAHAAMANGTSSGAPHSFAAHAKRLARQIRLVSYGEAELASRATQMIAQWPTELA